MVKYLLGTTAIVGTILFSLTSQKVMAGGEASAPTLKINGNSVMGAYFGNQQRRENGKGGPQPHMEVGASDLYWTIKGISPSGIEYMYKLSMNAIPGASPVIEQNYIQFKGTFGTVQVGDVPGTEDTMVYDAGKIIGGTGGFDGGYGTVFNISAGALYGNDVIGDTGYATKFVYYSPEIWEFWQIGFAYTPSTAHMGDGKLDNATSQGNSMPGIRGLYPDKKNAPFGLRNMALGLTFKRETGKWSITLSGVGLTEKSYYSKGNGNGRISLQNATAYQLGFVLGYGSFRFGGGFLDSGKSRLPKTAALSIGTSGGDTGNFYQGNSGHAYNVGAGYTMGAYQMAVSYQGTNRKTDATQRARNDVYSATLDVTPLPGLKFYGEVDYIRSRTNSAAVAVVTSLLKSKDNSVGVGNNSGAVAILGTKVSF